MPRGPATIIEQTAATQITASAAQTPRAARISLGWAGVVGAGSAAARAEVMGGEGIRVVTSNPNSGVGEAEARRATTQGTGTTCVTSGTRSRRLRSMPM